MVIGWVLPPRSNSLQAGNVKGCLYNYCINIIQLLQSGGSTQPIGD